MQRPSGALLGLGAMLVAAGSAAAVVVAVPAQPPAALRTASPARTVAVTERTDADERQVQLALDTGAPRAVVTNRTGTVTASSCSTGAPLVSGDVIARVDGQPVVALATGEPLWRDLEPGDRGEDVSGLQAELTRLGAGLAVDGLVGPGTLRAARQFLVDRGVTADDLPDGVVPRAPFAWVPAVENSVRACTAVLGAPVDTEGTLVELPAELRGARIETLPADPAPGDRVLRIGGAEVPVDARGVVSAPDALAAVAALPEYAVTVSSADGVPTLPVAWSLRRPRTVQVVPPTALWNLDGDRACVQPTSGPAREVEVLGSELGQSFVRGSEGRPLDRVRTDPDRSRPCR
ncbi:hypothetical protein DEI99_002625 [Curtobacterium sp. MCLR17_036]|uniref:peptidoglycan-binding domain-containing protein n=1 Tax=Curtobacterium sp. MCLR17_036 TaxID=2175620 RepID=UPI0011B6BD99|nr:hypothetical protein [Curtobacterium sp. MCLR17_036]WIE65447.1 hypothetical protein DEI99_002625 [Curtobacterium sp. MCLR17_036]